MDPGPLDANAPAAAPATQTVAAQAAPTDGQSFG